MRFTNIELELQPMTGLAMIENALTPAHDGVRAGLQVQIRLRSHWLDDVHDRLKPRGRISRFRKLSTFEVFRPNPKQHWFARNSRACGRSANRTWIVPPCISLNTMASRSCFNSPLMKFIGGLPRNPATKRLSGS